MGTFGADIRYAFRMLRNNPGFTAIAVAALALGIGANTAIFTVVNTVLLQPLPYPEPDRIMQLGRQFRGGRGNLQLRPEIHGVAAERCLRVDGALSASAAQGTNIGAGDRPEQAKAARVSQGTSASSAPPRHGPHLHRRRGPPNGPAVMVLSYGLWQSRFGGDPNILGRSIPLDGKPTTIIGVLPKSFRLRPARRPLGAAAGRPRQHQPGPLPSHRRPSQAGRHPRAGARRDEGRRRALPRRQSEVDGRERERRRHSPRATPPSAPSKRRSWS